MPTITTREEIATHAYLRCFGALPDSSEEDQRWGLKASSEDALLSVLVALYPSEFPSHTADSIYKLRGHPVAALIGTDTEEGPFTVLEQEGNSADVIVEQTLPLIDNVMAPVLLAEARRLGVDVEAERCDWYMVASMLHEIRALPDVDVPAAVRAVNDGATVADLDSYRGTPTSAPFVYVVMTCHDGTDWCVRKATVEEVSDEDEETLPLAEAREFAAEVAAEHGTRWFDFSGEA